MKHKKVINIRFHADEDLFLADIEEGWIRVGMLDNECFDFAPYHPSYNEVNNLTEETIEKFYDERYAKFAVNYYPR